MNFDKPSFAEMIEFAKAYQQLGWTVQQQLDIISNGSYDDLNTNAVEEIMEFVEHAIQTMDVDEDSFNDVSAACEDFLRIVNPQV